MDENVIEFPLKRRDTPNTPGLSTDGLKQEKLKEIFKEQFSELKEAFESESVVGFVGALSLSNGETLLFNAGYNQMEVIGVCEFIKALSADEILDEDSALERLSSYANAMLADTDNSINPDDA